MLPSRCPNARSSCCRLPGVPHLLVSSQTNQGLVELGAAIRESLVAQRPAESNDDTGGDNLEGQDEDEDDGRWML
jgi:hypothetical protein